MSPLPLPAGSVHAVGRSLEYIEDHLGEAIGVAEMAAVAGFSLFHFVRVFNLAVHHTPYDYLVRRRLSVAAGRLTSGDERVIDLALAAGFASPEAFARAFRRMFGAGPSEYRQAGGVNASRRLAPRTLEHLRLLTHPAFHPPQRRRQPALRLAGLMAPVGPLDRAALWSDLACALPAVGWPTESAGYGVTLHLRAGAAGRSFYLAALALDPAPLPLVSLELSAGEYAAFTCTGSISALPLVRDYLYQTWLPLSGLRPAAPVEVEVYPAGHPQAGAGALSLWVPVGPDLPCTGVEIPQKSGGKP